MIIWCRTIVGNDYQFLVEKGIKDTHLYINFIHRGEKLYFEIPYTDRETMEDAFEIINKEMCLDFLREYESTLN